MPYKTDLDRKISVVKKYIQRWEEILSILAKEQNNETITKKERSDFYETINWCSRKYSIVEGAEREMTTTDFQTGVKAVYPVVMESLSRFQVLHDPSSQDARILKASLLALKAHLGRLENTKNSIGEVKIEDYKKLQSLIERLRLEHSSVDSMLSLAESCEFLELDFNWILSAIALQLQEVGMTLVARKLGIKLDRPNVSKILGKRLEKGVSFKDRYKAFCREIKRQKDTTLSQLPTDLREMRTRVLHEGVSPRASEAKLITNFTCTFLDDLNSAIR